MKIRRHLRTFGKSFWLGSITRDLLSSGILGYYIDELSVIYLITAIRLGWQEE